MTGYYDYVLGLIPVALFGLTGTLTVAGFGLTQAVPIAAGVAACIIGHALFVNGPVSAGASQSVETDVSTTTRSNPATPVDAD
ncbi:hypothetical protein [Halogeometricum limi]|uniref:Uncharacterized protein n=1 Tax=Halogeometricum limi TaxID=555875 RepID=A0A1I6HWT0_9EURY|nr:hypothetical protein [Halogeometricum limi]SFR58670.1 hypothetical protein SAMN04488124_2529 [Halogeometricum limi]